MFFMKLYDNIKNWELVRKVTYRSVQVHINTKEGIVLPTPNTILKTVVQKQTILKSY